MLNLIIPQSFYQSPFNPGDVGEDVEVLATLSSGSGTGDDHIVAVRQGNALAIAFYPELTADDSFMHSS